MQPALQGLQQVHCMEARKSVEQSGAAPWLSCQCQGRRICIGTAPLPALLLKQAQHSSVQENREK